MAGITLITNPTALNVPLTNFPWAVRIRATFAKLRLKTLWDLAHTTEAQLAAHKSFGKTSMSEVKKFLKEKGLRLGMM